MCDPETKNEETVTRVGYVAPQKINNKQWKEKGKEEDLVKVGGTRLKMVYL
jgi:hypothetical protein